MSLKDQKKTTQGPLPSHPVVQSSPSSATDVALMTGTLMMMLKKIWSELGDKAPAVLPEPDFDINYAWSTTRRS